LRDAATLTLTLPSASDVQVALYDVLGRRVRTFADGRYPAGAHVVTVRAAGLAPGLYLVRLHAEGSSRTQRLTVVR
jgi:hypothetical protein